ncbi:23520_t:CDS:2, partial [Racocetra persica]
SSFMALAFKVDPDFSNVVDEALYAIQTIYEFARKGIYPINVVFFTILDTPGWEDYASVMAQRYFDKYKSIPQWAREWEFIPNVKPYIADVISDRIKQFEKVRA